MSKAPRNIAQTARNIARRVDEAQDAADAPVRTGRTLAVFIVLAVLVVVFAYLNLVIGTTHVSLGQIGQALFGGDGPNADQTTVKVIWDIRLPRLIAAIVLGGALALSGFLLQTFFNNPIASPYILGISSGAKLAVAFVMIVVIGAGGIMTSWAMVAAAFLGALVVTAFVLVIARHMRSMSMLIVAGVMVGYICSAITDILIAFASDASIVNLKNWSLGSLSGVNWSDVTAMCLVVGAAFIVTFALAKPIGSFQMGEAYAQTMGVNIRVFRSTIIVLSSLLAACVTAFAGPVSFVGIAVPHLVKSFLKTSRPLVVIPACFLGGAAFCLGCDLIARVLFAPTELSLSAVTAVFGAPVVIAMLLRREGGE